MLISSGKIATSQSYTKIKPSSTNKFFIKPTILKCLNPDRRSAECSISQSCVGHHLDVVDNKLLQLRQSSRVSGIAWNAFEKERRPRIRCIVHFEPFDQSVLMFFWHFAPLDDDGGGRGGVSLNVHRTERGNGFSCAFDRRRTSLRATDVIERGHCDLIQREFFEMF